MTFVELKERLNRVSCLKETKLNTASIAYYQILDSPYYVFCNISYAAKYTRSIAVDYWLQRAEQESSVAIEKALNAKVRRRIMFDEILKDAAENQFLLDFFLLNLDFFGKLERCDFENMDFEVIMPEING